MAQHFQLSPYNIQIPLRDDAALLFNSVTESLVLLEGAERAWLSQFDGDVSCEIAEDSETGRLMAAGGYIVPASRNQLSDISARYSKKRNDPARLGITITTTLGCNLACNYCFQGQMKSSGRFGAEAREGVLRLVSERAAELSTLSVTWYGGEPLMNQGEIWETTEGLLAICKAHDIEYGAGIVTNGYLLNLAVARKLLECSVRFAQVTVDGTQDAHDRMRPHVGGRGSYARIMQNLREVVFETELIIALRISADTNNAADIRALLHTLAEEGFAGRANFSVYFAPIEAISEGCNDYEELSLPKREYAALELELLELATDLKLKRHKQFGQDQSLCQAVRPSDMVIAPNGDLHKCWDTISFERLKLANVADANALALLADNSWTDWEATNNAICRECKILPICGGGCAFKTVHDDQQAGEAASLPCISLKFNLAERLFLVARAAGVVTADMWDPQASPTAIDGDLKTGQAHYPGSVREQVLAPV